MSELSIPVSPARRRSASLIGRIVKYRHYYALLLPALAIFLLFRYVPMAGIVIAFKKYNLVDGLFGSPWVGFTYFERLFNSPQFYRVLKNTVVISLLKVLIGFPGPIIFALMLNEIANLRGKKIFQTISYLPHFVSWVVVGGLIRDLLSQRGIVNYLTGLFGADPVIFLQQEEMFVPILILSMIWKNVGWGSIIYLAAISSIDPQLYEAAALDGAGRIQRIRHVTLPSIVHVIVILFLLRIGDIMEAGFDQIFNLYNPLVYSVADIIDTYVFRTGITDFQYSYAAAVDLFKNLTGLILLLIVNYGTKRLGSEATVV